MEVPVPGARVETLLREGRWRAAARCALRAVSAAPASDDAWPQAFAAFSALMCARRYAEAFHLGESLLDVSSARAGFRCLLWPWAGRGPQKGAAAGFCRAEAARLRAFARRRGASPWTDYCLFILSGCQRGGDRLLALKPGSRYGWMRQALIRPLSSRGSEGARQAAGVCRGLLRAAPDLWFARCYLGEFLVADGRGGAGLRQFQLAARRAPAGDRALVLAWQAEVLLWLGRYRRALALCEAAARSGPIPFARGWRGAAWLKLGSPAQAVRDLDEALRLDPGDLEAVLWRGEALRAAGRPRRALADADRFVRLAPPCFFGFAVRALIRLDLGDRAGAARDAARAEAAAPQAAALLRRRSRRGVRARLEAGLAAARGLRRWEPYLSPLWLRALAR